MGSRPKTQAADVNIVVTGKKREGEAAHLQKTKLHH